MVYEERVQAVYTYIYGIFTTLDEMEHEWKWNQTYLLYLLKLEILCSFLSLNQI
jgi:hypothetical protein